MVQPKTKPNKDPVIEVLKNKRRLQSTLKSLPKTDIDKISDVFTTVVEEIKLEFEIEAEKLKATEHVVGDAYQKLLDQGISPDMIKLAISKMV